MDAIGYAFVIGAVPTASMILTSTFIAYLHVPGWIEAMLQNFAAGLILAVVGNEFFPLLTDGASKEDTEIGITIGFVVGLITIHGTEYLADLFTEEEKSEDEDDDGVSADGVAMTESAGLWNKNREFYKSVAAAMGIIKKKKKGETQTDEGLHILPSSATEDDSPDSIVPFDSKLVHELEENIETDIRKSVGFQPHRMNDIVDDSMSDAQRAITDMKHRRRIESRLLEMLISVRKMRSLIKLVVSGTAEVKQTGPSIDGNENPLSIGGERIRKLSVRETESLAEKIDEEIHVLQYKLDHSRRLLQGTDFDFDLSEDGSLPDWANTSVLDPGKKFEMSRRVDVLCVVAEHLVEHVQGSSPIGPYELKEIYMHMDEMHGHLESFHTTIEKFGGRWERRRESMIMPRKGDNVPTSLVIPVAMDAFTDGLLIGVTAALTKKAGLIVAVANTMEMGILGMAYSARISKCTGSSAAVRYLCLYLPPILMLLATALGAFLANEATSEPIVHVSFVGFGIVALLALVCSELLIEARELQGEEEEWYIGICVFAGVYLVLMLSPNLDGL